MIIRKKISWFFKKVQRKSKILAALTKEKNYSVNFTEQQKKFCSSLHYNGVNSYLFVNSVKIYKFEAKNSEKNAAPLCLGNVSKESSADNIKNRLVI